MKKIINNLKGFTLTELLAGIPLMILVGLIMTVSLLHFIKEYNEIELYARLQSELFDAIETMRYGYAKEGITDENALIGLLTAEEVSFSLSRNSVTIKPKTQDGNDTDEAEFYVDELGRLRASGKYGINTFSGEIIFPSTNKKIGNDYQFEITNHSIFTPIERVSGNIVLMGIEIEAKVRFRERATNQSLADDLRLNTKKITYRTKVFIGNAS